MRSGTTWRVATASLVAALLAGSAAGAAAQEPPEGAGEPVAVSAMGPPDAVATGGRQPAIAYDPSLDRALVVWVGSMVPAASTDVDVFAAFVPADGAAAGETFQVTDIGGPGQATFSTAVDVVHNPARGEFLVTWAGADSSVNPDFDIWVQRVDATTGELIGAAARISSLADPILIIALAVAYNSVDDQYLVTWSGIDDDPEPPLERFEDEVYGQLLDGEATEIGPDDLRISRIQGDGDTGNVEVFFVDVAHSPVTNEYLVVWEGLAYLGGEIRLTGLDIEQSFIDLEFEISGRFLDREANLVGEELLMSADELPGPPPEPLPAEWPSDDLDSVLPDRSQARRPQVVYNPVAGSFMVAWLEDGAENGLAPQEFEVFARTVGTDRALGAELQVSEHGPAGAVDYRANELTMTVEPATGDHFVAWSAADPDGDLDAENEGSNFIDESEIWGRWLDAGGLPAAGPYQLTETGLPGEGAYDAFNPAVAPASDGVLVAWVANQPGMATEEREFAGRITTVYDIEVFARRIDAPEPPPPPTTTAAPTTTTTNLGEDALTTTTTLAPATTTNAAVAADESGGSTGGIIVIVAILAVVAATAAAAVTLARRRGAG